MHLPVFFFSFFFSFVVVHYVIAAHIVNPGHFYVRYMMEQKSGLKLTKKVNGFCSGDSSLFTFSDEIKTGICMLIMVSYLTVKFHHSSIF